ncbi:MAG: M28 family peptidase [Proteobacteria bacterium]|nr:M28 family peptidase [Pseudomonadota bacterium]
MSSLSRRSLPLLAAAALIVPATLAQAKAPPPVPAVKVPAISVDTLKDVTRVLASDAFEGRGPGTAGEDKTVAEIISRFKAAGLKPGNKGSWTQPVPTVVVEAQNLSPLTVKAGGQVLSFAHGKDYVAGSYRIVPHTAIAEAPLVFVGYGINAPELGWNDYAGLDMKGKIAVILINDPDYAQADEAGLFKGRRMTYYGRWTYKFEEAARQGAAGALIVHDTFPAAYGWQVVQSSWSGKQKYVQSANDGMDQTQANGWIQKPVAEAVFKAAGQDFAALSEAAKHKGFKAVPLGAVASLSFDNAVERATSHNVIGIQPGKTRPNEYVLYTAHWDHLGRCQANAKGDDICNGAMDNATGVAALVALAEANRRAGPAPRSQVFLAVTLEESGLLGSEYYARNPLYPLARTVGGVNMDVVAPGSPSRDVMVTGGDKSDLTRYLQAVAKTMNLTIVGEDHPERGHYYRSDHFSFAKRGVPMFSVGRGTDWVKGGKAAGEAAADAYTNNDYHQPSDEFHEDWDWSGALQETTLLYRLGRSLAETTDWPNWHKTDEFRLIRDRSRAGVK